MTLQINTFRLRDLLNHGLTFLLDTPSAPNREHWLTELRSALPLLQRTDEETERAYQKWRRSHSESLRAHHALRRVCDEVRHHCDGHGISGYPEELVPHQEVDRTRAFGLAMSRFLADHREASPGLVPFARQLEDAMDRAMSEANLEQLHLKDYKEQAVSWKVVLRHCRELVVAHFEDVKGAIAVDSPTLQSLSPYPY